MKTYIISDHHFFHKNIIKYTRRPFNHEYEMNAYMIEQWNKTVKSEDMVLHLGDFFAGLKGRHEQAKSLINKLNGTKYLIRGNHDHYTNEEYINMGFKNVGDFLIKGNILFTHYPLAVDEKYKQPGHDLTQRLFEKNEIITIFHGHRHSSNPKIQEFENHVNVCVEQYDYIPQDLYKILEDRNELVYLKS